MQTIDKAPAKRVIFLHIPKTAGQSVHHFLSHFFTNEEMAPARVNEQLVTMSIKEMHKYKLFSGHLDWSLLDCLGGTKFTFTILREPISRIVSFYLYLLREAKALSPEALRLPQNTGKRMILEMSCDQYFTGGAPAFRAFLDNHYNNFYAFYFAGRRFDARQKLVGQQMADKSFTDEKIVDMAIENLSLLDGVYSVDALRLLEKDIRKLMGLSQGGPTLEALQVNKGDASNTDERMITLEKLGATKITFTKIKEMTILDQEIWLKYNGKNENGLNVS